MELYILLLIIIPIVTAFVIPLLDLIYKKARKPFIVIAAIIELLIAFIFLINKYSEMIAGELAIRYYLGAWSSEIGITLYMDSFGLVFSLMVSISVFLIIIYSLGFIGHHEGKYYVILFLLWGAMQGSVITGDIFNLYVFLELMTITSAALITFKRNRQAAEAAFKYIVYGVLGGVFILLSIFLIYYNVGSLNMEYIARNFDNINSRMQITILAFMLTGILIKLGVFPFHFWRPKAYAAAPSSITALLSGILLNVYLLILIRLFWFIIPFDLILSINLQYFVFYLALLTCTIGHVLALREDDIKRMLAFSTIGHLGMIIAAFALNTTAGFYGGLLHTVTHLIMKTTLFLIVGYFLQFTGGYHFADFNGIAYKNKGIFIVFVLSAMGMIGIPPLPGFFSKWYIVKGMLESGHYLAGFLILLLSIIAIFYYLRFILRGYSLVDEENKILSKKLKQNLTVFYRERTVLSVIYIFAFFLIMIGVFYDLLTEPLMASILNILEGF
ncbi:complex I subunit 5 family protein [Natronospora cellulosivora (SeqCode)]